MPRRVDLFAPSRLHFGLMSLGTRERKYGGVGVMIDRPGLRLRLESASSLLTVGPLAERVARAAEAWGQTHGREAAARIEVVEAPPEHVGLGVGTQTALAIAAGLNALHGLPAATALELAASVGRGRRSAVGTHGFVLGGLIVEQGKREGELLSPLDCRLDLPEDWRFLLVRPEGMRGLSGEEEVCAFPEPSERLEQLFRALVCELNERLVPAAATADFERFAESLYQYAHRAGLCFESRQGGAYNGPLLTQLVARLRELGAVGVGQSSWGPTLYAVQPSEAAARELQQRLLASWSGRRLVVDIARPWNEPARIELSESR
jgi:beta-RFAP synthase